jgi:peptidoglycan/LPS O-acetylase OafA/YrhL
VSVSNGGKDTRYAALDALRGVAVLMVVYDHLFAVAGERFAGQAFAPVPAVREHITGPLGIIQDFGWFGVCLFFLISGFVILHAARRETVGQFVIRRGLRIFPPLAVAVAVLAVLEHATGQPRPFTDYLLGVSLWGYFSLPQVVVLGVAWTLVIELFFYALVALVIPLLRERRAVFGVAVMTLVPALMCALARDFGDRFFLFAVSATHLPVLLMGSTLYLWRQGLCGGAVAALLFVVNWAVFAWAVNTIHTTFAPLNNSYLLSLVYSLAVFNLCLNWQPPRWLKAVGDMSYSLYLLHGTIGFAVVVWLVPRVGPAMWLPWLATAVVMLASMAMWRWVERPSIALGRRWSAHGLSRPQAEAASAPG